MVTNQSKPQHAINIQLQHCNMLIQSDFRVRTVCLMLILVHQ